LARSVVVIYYWGLKSVQGGVDNVHTLLLSVNNPNQTKTADAFFVVHILLPGDHITRLHLSNRRSAHFWNPGLSGKTFIINNLNYTNHISALRWRTLEIYSLFFK